MPNPPLGFTFTALGYCTGAAVYRWAARQRRLLTEGMVCVALCGFALGILGAKFAEWFLMHPALAATHPVAFLNPANGGRTLLGGLVGGWLGVELCKARLGIRRSTGDLWALALPAGEAVGRIGCLFNGCCYGVPSNVPWAIYQHGAWRHPAQLYAALIAAMIFVALLNLRRHIVREGDLFKLYLVLFGLGRFALEFWRQRQVAFAGLSVAQLVGIELALSGVVALYLPHHRPGNLQMREA